ncbi:MAG: hypothetical protein PVF43_04545 [Candidatus Eiseniibacteriota bacterium]|jgi:hypothetical protein
MTSNTTSRWLLGAIIGLAAVTAVTIAGLRSPVSNAKETATPAATAAQSTEASAGDAMLAMAPDGAAEVLNGHPRYPTPDDPEWDDYQAMMAHPMFHTTLSGQPGYRRPYDPDWRAVVTGKRAVEPLPDEIEFDGGEKTLDDLGRRIVDALNAEDSDHLNVLRINRREFETILWPEFPQSRPFAGIPGDEAYMFHFAKCRSGSRKAIRQHGGKGYEYLGIETGSVDTWTNFMLYEDVIIRVRDPQSREEHRLDFVPTIAKRNGHFKVYLYDD